jgi:hypothetical protein
VWYSFVAESSRRAFEAYVIHRKAGQMLSLAFASWEVGMREREERECGGMMDSYDVRKAMSVLILVCTEYVGLYRRNREPPRGSQVSGDAHSQNPI